MYMYVYIYADTVGMWGSKFDSARFEIRSEAKRERSEREVKEGESKREANSEAIAQRSD